MNIFLKDTNTEVALDTNEKVLFNEKIDQKQYKKQFIVSLIPTEILISIFSIVMLILEKYEIFIIAISCAIIPLFFLLLFSLIKKIKCNYLLTNYKVYIATPQTGINSFTYEAISKIIIYNKGKRVTIKSNATPKLAGFYLGENFGSFVSSLKEMIKNDNIIIEK